MIPFKGCVRESELDRLSRGTFATPLLNLSEWLARSRPAPAQGVPCCHSVIFRSGRSLRKISADDRIRAKLDCRRSRYFSAYWIVDAADGNRRGPRRGLDRVLVLCFSARKHVVSYPHGDLGCERGDAGPRRMVD